MLGRDPLTPEQRRRAMQGNRSRGTWPEKVLGLVLRKHGWRFGRNVRSLPGTPDLAFRTLKVAVFVDGKLWHAPRRRRGALSSDWHDKLDQHRRRDARATLLLRAMGWGVVRVQEEDLKRDLLGTVDELEYRIVVRSAPMRESRARAVGA